MAKGRKQNTPKKENKKVDQSGVPGSGAGRREKVGGSGVYPASGPWPAGDAPLHGEASWGQGERGAAGYEDSGDSEVIVVPPGQPGAGGSETAPTAGAGNGEIPREQWQSFLDGFSQQHEGWLVNVEVQVEGQAPRMEARELPLQSIAASLKKGDDDTISIILSQGDTPFITHSVSGVTAIRLLQNKEGAHEGLEIDSPGQKTFVRFRSPARPETVDGVATWELS